MLPHAHGLYAAPYSRSSSPTVASIAWLPVYGGRFLQHEDPLENADAIFVLAGAARRARARSRRSLQGRWAPLIILSGGRVEPAEGYWLQRGISFPREGDPMRDAMVQLGVPAAAIFQPPESVDNTGEEANVLRAHGAGPPLAPGDRRHVEVPHAPRGVRLPPRPRAHRR